MFASGFALLRPWGLHDDAGESRVELRPETDRMDVPAGCGVSVVAPAGLRLRVSGRKTQTAQPEGGPFQWNGEKRYWTVPIGSDSGEASFRFLIDSALREHTAIDVTLTDAPARPKEPGTETHSKKLFSLLLSSVERIHSLADGIAASDEMTHQARGRRLIASEISWRLVMRRWLEEYGTGEPPLDIIVKHSETLDRTIEALSGQPRRMLKRVRERLPLTRVQEMDATCLQWYVRQPGRTPAEKAGPRQAVLAIARRENFDTLENRVLRDYLGRAAFAANEYVALHRGLKASTRMRRVDRYGRLCVRLERMLGEAGISRPSATVVPNYVLSNDKRYSQVWDAWLELLRREQEVDDIWRWQTRLWAEFVQISLEVALRRLPDARIIAEAPMQIRADQRRGCWTDNPAHSAVVVIPVDDRRMAVTVIDARNPDAAQFGPEALWDTIWSSGPSCVLHAQDLATGEETWVLNWSLHPIDGRPLDLDREARSADRALASVGKRIALEGGGHHRLRGVILASSADGAEVREGADGNTVAYSCPVGAESLTVTIEAITGMIPVILGA